MISVTRINGDPITVNADLIETIESTPDTVITLTTGRKYMVREPAVTVVRRSIEFQRAVAVGRVRAKRRRVSVALRPESED